MKTKHEEGFASVYIVLMLSGLMVLMLVLMEISSGYAASSLIENCCYVAGRSVLSEYQKDVFERYGLFCLRNDDENLKQMASYYINSNLAVEKGILKPELKECHADSSCYSGLDYEVLSRQVNIIGAGIAAKQLLDSDFIENINEILNFGDGKMEDLADSALDTIKSCGKKPAEQYDEEGNKVPESEESKSRRAQARELKNRYEEAQKPLFGQIEGGKDLSDQKRSDLPTGIMDIKKTAVLLFASGITEFSPGALAQAVYIRELCSDYVRPMENSCLEAEMEYILFGNNSDSENVKAARQSIYSLRLAFNLASIYADQSKIAEYTAIAAASFPLIPAPAVVFVLAFTDAASQANADLGQLLSGGCVALPGLSSFGTYSDYLMLMLAVSSEQTRMLRLMDIIQVNCVTQDGANFRFRDYCYGFEMTANFSKKVYLPLSFDINERNSQVLQVHAYK